MKISILMITLVAVIVSGCASTETVKEGKAQVVSRTDADDTVFSASNPNAFVFKNVPELLQEFGYDNFCKNTETFACANRLSYRKYHGMKGYFESMEPVKTLFEHEFRSVVLANGEKFFYVSNTKYGGVFSKSAPIVSLAEVKNLSDLVGERVVTGNKIRVTKSEDRDGWFILTLSNGVELRDDQYKSIKVLLKDVNGDEKTNELLKLFSELYISYDKIENRYFIRGTGADDFPLEAYVGHKENETWLRMKVFYRGSDWLFVKSYLVVADNLRYESERSYFERDHSGGKIWEWRDIRPNAEQIALLKTATTASEVTVRFNGQKYHDDRTLPEKGKRSLSKILRVYELLGQ